MVAEALDGAAEANWAPAAVPELLAGSGSARMASTLKAPAFTEARPATTSIETTSNRLLNYRLNFT